MSDGTHGVMIIWPPNSGVGIINVFKGDIDSTHYKQTRGGEIFSQVVCNGVVFYFLVTVVCFFYHNFSIISILINAFEASCAKECCVLYS